VKDMSLLASNRLASPQRILLLSCGLAASGLFLGGCEYDSFLADPSVTGRWEWTPTTVPVLERISTIEDKKSEEVGYGDPTADDLLPDPRDYRVGAGDELEFQLWDLVEEGRSEIIKRQIDRRGMVDLPQLGRIYVANKTIEQVREAVSARMERFVREPLVAIDVTQQRNQTFSIIGAVEQPGPYFIPKADYRVLEAMTSAGSFPWDTTPYLFIIRQVVLDESLTATTDPMKTDGGPKTDDGSPADDTTGQDILKVIDDLSKPKTPDPAVPEGTPKQPSPAMLLPAGGRPGRIPQPAADAPPPDRRKPTIDLIDGKQPRTPTPGTTPAGAGPETSFVFVNGRWMEVRKSAANGAADDAAVRKAAADLITQRVIRVPLKRLLEGDSTVNIVVRPGDVIRVPANREGEVYVGGQVQRPGVYNLSRTGRVTLSRIIFAAGGLGNLAVPERVDLTRVVGEGRQATVRLDLRAIYEGTQPDIYLKADDTINIGTNFWALPMAVIRNGFRFNYGFGFVIDRNFGNDLFGPPRVNSAGQE
jgi:polysaccharide export outer membrane protein